MHSSGTFGDWIAVKVDREVDRKIDVYTATVTDSTLTVGVIG